MKRQNQKIKNVLLLCDECSRGWSGKEGTFGSVSTQWALELQKELLKVSELGGIKVLTTSCHSLCPQGAITVQMIVTKDGNAQSHIYALYPDESVGDVVSELVKMIKTP